MLDHRAWFVVGGIGTLLTIATVVAILLRKTVTDESKRRTIENLYDRTLSWWAMVAMLIVALSLGQWAVVVLFGLVSFRALREMVTLTHTRRGDHRTLFYAFFIVTPLQYVLIATHWYGMFVVMIPVWGFLWLAIRSAISGDIKRYQERASRVFWALMICVYCLSHAPALLLLDSPIVEGHQANLLVFMLVVV